MSGVVIRETIRRHVTHVGYLAALLLITLSGLTASQAVQAGSLWPSLVTLLAAVTGCAIIGPEFSSGTLQLILVKPINRSVYLLSRVTGVVAVVWLAAVLGSVAEGLARLFNGSLALRFLGVALINSMAETLLIVALLTLLGSLTRAYFNVAIFYGLNVGLSITIGIMRVMRKVPVVIPDMLAVMQRNLFPDVPSTPAPGLLLLLVCNASVALLLACIVFTRREVPYGAD